MNAVFVHFSDQRYQADGDLRSHYEAVYENMEGYVLPNHWFELPKWMADVAGMLPEETTYEVHVVTNMKKSIKYLNETPENTVIFGSVMDINREDWLNLIDGVNRWFILGGYVNGVQFQQDIDDPRAHSNVTWLESIDSLVDIFEGTQPQSESKPDYSIFAGERTIPRLTMSSGCSYKCNFCTIRNTRPIPVPVANIKAQIDSWKDLDFELVYIDDKTFGQAETWKLLGRVRDRILDYNPDFKGFIVQTTGTELLKLDRDTGKSKLEIAVGMGVKYVEVGLEIIDDKILAQIQKPHRVKHLNMLADAVREQGISLIPNVLLCLPEANYTATVEWIADNLDIIPACNFFNLSVYDDSKGLGGDWLPEKRQPSDSDELSFERSWLDMWQQEHSRLSQERIRRRLERREFLIR